MAQCNCGRVLMRDAPRYDDPYWTLHPVDIAPTDLLAENCPVCGGDERRPMGNYYYKRSGVHQQAMA
ncbi:MAG: hypothetical protein Q7T51_02845 [Candidatus Moranbacteria bacterium]|nr:hypothetical protein [Candidatus Moranbacteria bacterium]